MFKKNTFQEAIPTFRKDVCKHTTLTVVGQKDFTRYKMQHNLKESLQLSV